MTTNFNATTPQSKVLKDAIDAYLTLDLTNAMSSMSKDFKFQTFPMLNFDIYDRYLVCTCLSINSDSLIYGPLALRSLSSFSFTEGYVLLFLFFPIPTHGVLSHY